MVQEEVKAMMNFVVIVVSSSDSVSSRDSNNIIITTLLSLVKRREGDGVCVCDSGWLGKNSWVDLGVRYGNCEVVSELVS